MCVCVCVCVYAHEGAFCFIGPVHPPSARSCTKQSALPHRLRESMARSAFSRPTLNAAQLSGHDLSPTDFPICQVYPLPPSAAPRCPTCLSVGVQCRPGGGPRWDCKGTPLCAPHRQAVASHEQDHFTGKQTGSFSITGMETHTLTPVTLKLNHFRRALPSPASLKLPIVSCAGFISTF